ncbi:hypothetical protein TELCIR_02882 [Teladorsagia circumcincta]|uniref:Uncharacterized protein n=1 Tax=Teladorsagia circumcincta TaxID=45464 RepID=A0A2G9UXW7_TELCI|nr:hypothetical protein TELCIR_02882 [Teladorsagia circumcincta]
MKLAQHGKDAAPRPARRRFIHWLELSTRKMMPSPRCELCGYNYRRRNYINEIYYDILSRAETD